MKYYLYDEKTKQFITEQEGYLDPLETIAEVEAIAWPEASK